MQQYDIAWLAGFIEGRGFYLQRNNKDHKKGSYYIVLKCGNSKNIEAFKKASRILGRPIARWGFTPAFAEKFDHENRPAVYTDGKNITFCIIISCRAAQDLVNHARKYLTTETLERLQPLLEYQLASYRRCPVTGQYRGKYRSAERRLEAKRRSGREYARRKRAAL